MKTILSLFILPIMVLAQPKEQQKYFDIEPSLDVAMASVQTHENNLKKTLNGSFELLITMEVYVEEVVIYQRVSLSEHYEMAANTLPQHLSTFSLVGLPHTDNKNRSPQEGLEHFIALNDSQFPKEDTLLDWLYPVTPQQNKWSDLANIPEGFGPRIRL